MKPIQHSTIVQVMSKDCVNDDTSTHKGTDKKLNKEWLPLWFHFVKALRLRSPKPTNKKTILTEATNYISSWEKLGYSYNSLKQEINTSRRKIEQTKLHPNQISPLQQF